MIDEEEGPEAEVHEDVLTQGQEVDLIHTREREHQEVGGRLVDRHQVSTTNLTREVDPQQTNIMKLPAEQKKIIICLRT
ncbi:hypothetical protein C0Q70_09624 [Pomacea canaliculata]|uniref:Uncharacterized protein n=1 Tax=Pomacea canaliculata TaxID=400727 RepID=A0A2T7PAB4_POMCA|nr:hypothetical protein C0Q70_09624 [Pomacea canaliculata]